jgi:histidyl-tRNA synthetase
MERIEPRTPSGFRDYGPQEAQARARILDTIRDVFQQHGFAPLDTPAMEHLEVLTGGDANFSKQLYRATLTEGDQPLGMRFDLTVPMARYVAAHASELSFPFSRYQIGSVWRGEHAQAGRYREFTQCDADIVGSTGALADAQVIALAYRAFEALGLGQQILLRISDRMLLAGLAEYLDYNPALTVHVVRSIDKLEKQGWDVVARELAEHGLDAQQVDGIQELLMLEASSPEDRITQAAPLLAGATTSLAALDRLTQITAYLDALGIPRSAWTLDFSIARGLGYYTGMVFETTLTSLPQIGSIASGGRYDDLVSRFAPLELSGVGMSIGVDRLLAALQEIGNSQVTIPQCLIALLNFDAACQLYVLDIAEQLRKANIPTALYAGTDSSLKSQLAWAIKRNATHAIIAGSTEMASGIVQIKNLISRDQTEVPVKELANYINL